MELGARIRQLRQANGLSQAELGKGRYSGSYISHIESGRRVPNAEVLQFIAEQLKLPVSQLDPNDSNSADADLAALLSRARRYAAVNQLDDALRCVQEAIVIADRLGRESRAWEANIIKAKVLISAGRLAQAAQIAIQLAAEPCVATVPVLRAEAHTLAAYALRGVGDYAQAASQAHCAVQLANSIDAEAEAAALIELLGALSMSPEDLDTQLIEERLEHLIDDLNSVAATQITRALASVMIARGQTDAGVAMLERGLAVCEPRYDPKAWATMKLAIARAIVDSKNPDLAKAARYLQTASPIIMLTASVAEMAGLRLVQARLELRNGNLNQASKKLAQLMTQAEMTGDLIFAAEVAQSYAESLLASGSPQAAREALRKSASLFEKADAHQRALEIWHSFAAI